MVWVIYLAPTKSYSYYSSTFAHLELLIFNLQTTILLLGAIFWQTYRANKIDLRTIHQNKRKTLKERVRIGLAAMVTRAQETRKTELKRRIYG
jgi:hypothetical protein